METSFGIDEPSLPNYCNSLIDDFTQ